MPNGMQTFISSYVATYRTYVRQAPNTILYNMYVPNSISGERSYLEKIKGAHFWHRYTGSYVFVDVQQFV